MAARIAVVLLLLSAAGIASAAVDAPPGPAPIIPRVNGLISGTGWKVELAYRPVGGWMAYQQWLLVDRSGTRALLFVGATSRPQTLFRWTGEYGYLGDGFLVEDSTVRSIRAGDASGKVTLVHIRRGRELKLLAYSAVRPDGDVASGNDSPLGLGWDAVAHRGMPYYAARVTVTAPPAGIGAASENAAVGLLTSVLIGLPRR